MFKKFISIAVGSLLLLALGWPAARPAMAAPADLIFQVNSFLDEIDANVEDGQCQTASGTCTLRAAVMEADHSGSVDVTIRVPAGIYNLTIGPSGFSGDASSGDLDLTYGGGLIRLVGAGAARTIIDAQQIDRVMTVDAGGTALISGVTLRGGAPQTIAGGGLMNQGNLTLDQSIIRGMHLFDQLSVGGGLDNGGTLTLTNSTIADNSADKAAGLYNTGLMTATNSTFSGNHAKDWGGGINNLGTLTLVDSTISANSADWQGGGISQDSGILTLMNSTVSDNRAVRGGGGIFSNADLTLINSTLSQNQVTQDGGGLYNAATANLYNSTLVFNWADSGYADAGSGGGLFNTGVANLRNSLLAGNGVGDIRVHDDCTGNLNTYGQNLFGVVGDPTPCTINVGAGSWSYLNSLQLLGPLQDNGGPTLTHALLAGSNAIDAGDRAQGCIGPDALALPTDQRGRPRVAGDWCDIGAFEYTVPVLTPQAYLPFIGN